MHVYAHTCTACSVTDFAQTPPCAGKDVEHHPVNISEAARKRRQSPHPEVLPRSAKHHDGQQHFSNSEGQDEPLSSHRDQLRSGEGMNSGEAQSTKLSTSTGSPELFTEQF